MPFLHCLGPAGAYSEVCEGKIVGRGLAARAGMRGGRHPRQEQGLIEHETGVGAASQLGAKIAAERLGVIDIAASGAADFSAAVGLQQ